MWGEKGGCFKMSLGVTKEIKQAGGKRALPVKTLAVQVCQPDFIFRTNCRKRNSSAESCQQMCVHSHNKCLKKESKPTKACQMLGRILKEEEDLKVWIKLQLSCES